MKRVHRIVLWLLLPLVLSACGAAESRWAPDIEVARAAYVDDGPPTLTLYTVMKKSGGIGAHSGLMVNGSQRIMFDPAGTFKHPHLPERNDVIIGMSDAAVEFYIDYHARETYDVIEQVIPVSREVALLAQQKVMSYGAVPKGFCNKSITSILRTLPGFEDVPQGWFPRKTMEYFATRPGVTTRRIVDDSPDDNTGMIAAPNLLLNQRLRNPLLQS
jgi:hypothetical protein